MGALDGAKLAARTVKREPLLVAFSAGVAVLAAVLNGLWSIPLVGLLLGPLAGLLYVFVEPYVAAGLLGAADEAIDGELSRGTFQERAGEHYTDLLVARLVILLPAVAYAVLVQVGTTALSSGASLAFAERASAGPAREAALDAVRHAPLADPVTVAALTVASLVFAAGVVGYVLVQFYPAAIVVGGAGPLESFRYSYELVREYPVPALGYTALTALAGFALVLPTAVHVGVRALVRRSAPALSEHAVTAVLAGTLGAMVASVVTFLLVKTLVVSLVRTYHVAFVRTTLGN